MPGDGETVGRRDIVLYGKGGGLQHINYTHKNYDTFAYILFHIHGDEGWTFDIPQYGPCASEKHTTVTVRRYYAHRFMDRHSSTKCTHYPVSISCAFTRLNFFGLSVISAWN